MAGGWSSAAAAAQAVAEVDDDEEDEEEDKEEELAKYVAVVKSPGAQNMTQALDSPSRPARPCRQLQDQETTKHVSS